MSFLNISCNIITISVAFACLIYTCIITHILGLANICISVLYALLYLPFLVLHPELLMSYCPLVERLGFDENFMDITKMVEMRLAEMPDPHSLSFKGHVYNHFSESLLCL